EEFGFVGCVWVLLLLLLLLARLLALSQLANTPYERLICIGTSAAILCHVLIAVGMTIRLTPITGVPLPLVSYGRRPIPPILALQHALGGGEHHLLVVHHEDGLPAAVVGRRHRGLRLGHAVAAREQDMEHGAFAGLALRGNAAAMVAHDAHRGGQARAAALEL